MPKPEITTSSRTNNPTLDWCVGVESCTTAEAALRGINVADISSDTVVLVHDTKRPTEPPKVFTPHEWAAFIIGVKVGDFDKHVDQTALKEVEGAYANTH